MYDNIEVFYAYEHGPRVGHITLYVCFTITNDEQYVVAKDIKIDDPDLKFHGDTKSFYSISLDTEFPYGYGLEGDVVRKKMGRLMWNVLKGMGFERTN